MREESGMALRLLYSIKQSMNQIKNDLESRTTLLRQVKSIAFGSSRDFLTSYASLAALLALQVGLANPYMYGVHFSSIARKT
eukprot:1152579-Pelagomonas_calceolata.AAC.7